MSSGVGGLSARKVDLRGRDGLFEHLFTDVCVCERKSESARERERDREAVCVKEIEGVRERESERERGRDRDDEVERERRCSPRRRSICAAETLPSNTCSAGDQWYDFS